MNLFYRLILKTRVHWLKAYNKRNASDTWFEATRATQKSTHDIAHKLYEIAEIKIENKTFDLHFGQASYQLSSFLVKFKFCAFFVFCDFHPMDLLYIFVAQKLSDVENQTFQTNNYTLQMISLVWTRFTVPMATPKRANTLFYFKCYQLNYIYFSVFTRRKEANGLLTSQSLLIHSHILKCS